MAQQLNPISNGGPGWYVLVIASQSSSVTTAHFTGSQSDNQAWNNFIAQFPSATPIGGPFATQTQANSVANNSPAAIQAQTASKNGKKPNAKAKKTAPKKVAFAQPPFDPRIYTLPSPMMGKTVNLTRGYLIQENPLQGYVNKCVFHYQYNPSAVSADYSMNDLNVQASLLFANPSDTTDLAVPLSQTVNWTVMFDRTYELNRTGNPSTQQGGGLSNTHNNNATGANLDPSQIGVMADVLSLAQFTGMLDNYNYGFNLSGLNNSLLSGAASTGANSGGNGGGSFKVSQGVFQLVPCYAYFGNAALKNNMAYFGYVSEWSVQYTHWTEYNVPMRCVIAIYFTMMPPPGNGVTTPTAAAAAANQNYSTMLQTTSNSGNGPIVKPTGRAGR